MKSSRTRNSTGPPFGFSPHSPCCSRGLAFTASFLMALGRTPVQLRGMLLRDGLLMVMAGAIPGIVGAQLTGRFLQSLMDGAQPIGLAMSASLVLLFALLASASIWSATRRIARLNITAILRSE